MGTNQMSPSLILNSFSVKDYLAQPTAHLEVFLLDKKNSLLVRKLVKTPS